MKWHANSLSISAMCSRYRSGCGDSSWRRWLSYTYQIYGWKVPNVHVDLISIKNYCRVTICHVGDASREPTQPRWMKLWWGGWPSRSELVNDCTVATQVFIIAHLQVVDELDGTPQRWMNFWGSLVTWHARMTTGTEKRLRDFTRRRSSMWRATESFTESLRTPSRSSHGQNGQDFF